MGLAAGIVLVVMLTWLVVSCIDWSAGGSSPWAKVKKLAQWARVNAQITKRWKALKKAKAEFYAEERSFRRWSDDYWAKDLEIQAARDEVTRWKERHANLAASMKELGYEVREVHDA